MSLAVTLVGLLSCCYAYQSFTKKEEDPGDELSGELLNIHIVPHTHDDPGWIKTVDEYYIEEVQWIFYTMIPVLRDDPDRKFTYVEMAYMQRWWQEIDDNLKQETIDLVNNGQFQFNLGGWCMNDEANPTTSAVIHQMTDGNQFILSNMGIKGLPSVAWHVDPLSIPIHSSSFFFIIVLYHHQIWTFLCYGRTVGSRYFPIHSYF